MLSKVLLVLAFTRVSYPSIFVNGLNRSGEEGDGWRVKRNLREEKFQNSFNYHSSSILFSILSSKEISFVTLFSVYLCPRSFNRCWGSFCPFTHSIGKVGFCFFVSFISRKIGWGKAIYEILTVHNISTHLETIKNRRIGKWTKLVKQSIEKQNTKRLLQDCHKKEDWEEIRKTKTAHIVDKIRDPSYHRKPLNNLLKCTKFV